MLLRFTLNSRVHSSLFPQLPEQQTARLNSLPWSSACGLICGSPSSSSVRRMAGKSIFMLSLTLAHWLNQEGVGSLAIEAHEGGHGVVFLRVLDARLHAG